jgi:hypothetical protein
MTVTHLNPLIFGSQTVCELYHCNTASFRDKLFLLQLCQREVTRTGATRLRSS